MDLLDLRERLGARSDGDVLELRARERLPEDMATDHVIVDDQDGPAAHDDRVYRSARAASNG